MPTTTLRQCFTILVRFLIARSSAAGEPLDGKAAQSRFGDYRSVDAPARTWQEWVIFGDRLIDYLKSNFVAVEKLYELDQNRDVALVSLSHRRNACPASYALLKDSDTREEVVELIEECGRIFEIRESESVIQLDVRTPHKALSHVTAVYDGKNVGRGVPQHEIFEGHAGLPRAGSGMGELGRHPRRG